MAGKGPGNGEVVPAVGLVLKRPSDRVIAFAGCGVGDVGDAEVRGAGPGVAIDAALVGLKGDVVLDAAVCVRWDRNWDFWEKRDGLGEVLSLDWYRVPGCCEVVDLKRRRRPLLERCWAACGYVQRDI